MKPTKGDLEKSVKIVDQFYDCHKKLYGHEECHPEDHVAQALADTRAEAVRPLRQLLLEGLGLMRKINGENKNCVLPSDCPNHAWIEAVKQSIQGEEK